MSIEGLTPNCIKDGFPNQPIEFSEQEFLDFAEPSNLLVQRVDSTLGTTTTVADYRDASNSHSNSI